MKFGFTQAEVFAAMDEYGYKEKEEVKFWYDGFVFGTHRDIYSPNACEQSLGSLLSRK